MHAVTAFTSLLALAPMAMAAPSVHVIRALDKRYEHGWCGLQVHVNWHKDYSESGWYAVYDPSGNFLNGGSGSAPEDQPSDAPFAMDKKNKQDEGEPLDHELSVNVVAYGHEDNIVDFSYNGENWSSGAPGTEVKEGEVVRCAAGKWEKVETPGGGFYGDYTITINCGFTC